MQTYNIGQIDGFKGKASPGITVLAMNEEYQMNML